MTEPSESAQPGAGPFKPFVSTHPTGAPGTGPPWTTNFAEAVLHRIRSSPSVEEAQAQATTEAVIVLLSIRQILMWTAVIIPTVLVVLGVVFGIVLAAEPASPTGRYSYP